MPDAISYYEVLRRAAGDTSWPPPISGHLGVPSFIDTTPLSGSSEYMARGVTTTGQIIESEIVPVSRGLIPGRMNMLRLWGGTGGNPNSGFIPNKIAVDAARDTVVVVGYINYTVNVGTGAISSYGGQDCFIAKFKLSTGVCQWAYHYGQVSEDQFNGVAIDSAGNIYAVGQVSVGVPGIIDIGFGPESDFGSNDILLVKFSPAGTVLWHKLYGNTAADFGAAIAIDPTDDNNIYLAGTTGFFNGPGADFGGGAISTPSSPARTGYLVKINGVDGSYGGWQKAFGTPSNDTLPRYLTCGPDGHPVIAMDFLVSTNLGGGVLTAGGSGFNTVLAKFSKTNGALTWSNLLSSSSSSQIKGVKVDANGRVFVSGQFTGTITYSVANSEATPSGFSNVGFLVNYSYATGAWGSKFASFSTDSPTTLFDLAIDSAGAVVLSGIIDHGIDFGQGYLLGEAPDILLLKYNSSGSLVFARRGAPYGDDTRSVAIGPANVIVVAGTCGDPGVSGLRGSNGVVDPPLITVQDANTTKRAFYATVWP